MSDPLERLKAIGKTTEGPWRTGWLESYNGATGEPEAFVYRLPPDHPEETAHNRICVRGSKSAMDCDADARLIALAPALRRFAERVLELHKQVEGCLCDDETCRKKRARWCGSCGPKVKWPCATVQAAREELGE